jgi:hypothetical protein
MKIRKIVSILCLLFCSSIAVNTIQAQIHKPTTLPRNFSLMDFFTIPAGSPNGTKAAGPQAYEITITRPASLPNTIQGAFYGGTVPPNVNYVNYSAQVAIDANAHTLTFTCDMLSSSQFVQVIKSTSGFATSKGVQPFAEGQKQRATIVLKITGNNTGSITVSGGSLLGSHQYNTIQFVSQSSSSNIVLMRGGTMYLVYAVSGDGSVIVISLGSPGFASPSNVH